MMRTDNTLQAALMTDRARECGLRAGRAWKCCRLVARLRAIYLLMKQAGVDFISTSYMYERTQPDVF
jgi:hypothetical protein